MEGFQRSLSIYCLQQPYLPTVKFWNERGFGSARDIRDINFAYVDSIDGTIMLNTVQYTKQYQLIFSEGMKIQTICQF